MPPHALTAAVELVCGDETTSADREDGDSDERRVDPRALAAVCALDDFPTLFEQSLTWDAAALPPFQAAVAEFAADTQLI